jgi:MSHA biogenesis protein MshN
MSLINKMLQDLDKRGADTVAVEPMYAQIRTVALPASGRPWWLVLVPVLLMGSVLAWLLWDDFLPRQKANKVPATAFKQLSSVPASAKIQLPAAVATEVPVAATLAESGPQISELPLLLKLSSNLENSLIYVPPPEEKIPVLPVIARVEKLPSIQPEKPEKKATVVGEVNAKAIKPAPLVSTFSKEVSAQQQAEGEYRQATVLQQQGRSGEAIAMLEQTLKSDPQHAAARQSLIALLLENKRHDDAMRWLQQGLALDLNQPGLAMILARLQVEKGNLPRAIETLQRSLPHAADKADYLAFLAALQQRGAHHKDAAELYQRALRQNPQNALWWMGLAISLQGDGRNKEAIDAYGHAKTANGLSAELLAFVEQKIQELQR